MRYWALLMLVVAFFFSSILLFSVNEPSTIIYVSLDGKDTNPGTLEQPLANLATAVKVAEEKSSPVEIILRGGRYFLKNSVTIPRSTKESRLIIRAAEDEVVILDGSVLLNNIKPLEGFPDVYMVPVNFVSKYS